MIVSDLVLERRLSKEYTVRVYTDYDVDVDDDDMARAVEEGDVFGVVIWDSVNDEAVKYIWAMAGYGGPESAACAAVKDYFANRVTPEDLDAFFARMGCANPHEEPAVADTSKGYGIDLSGLGQVHPDEDEFVSAFFEALLWSESDDDGNALDRNYTDADFASESQEPLEREARAFYRFWYNEIHAELGQTAAHAGHDFALTRNGHGAGFMAGFWAGDWPMNGDLLTQGSKDYPEVHLYVGDDGLIWASGYEAGAYFRYNGSKQVSVLLPDATWLGPFTSRTAARNAYFKRVDVAPVDDQSQGYSIDLD